LTKKLFHFSTWAHQVGVDVVSIRAAATTVTVGVVVGCDIVAGVKGGDHCVLVALKGVILWTEVVVHKVGIAVVITTCDNVILSFLHNLFFGTLEASVFYYENVCTLV